MVDGTDLSTIRLRNYRSQMGVVLQDNFLFDGTSPKHRVRHPHATREESSKPVASRIAKSFINGFADGYDTIVVNAG